MNTTNLTAKALSAAYTVGETTPLEVTEICLKRIYELNPSINAFTYVNNDTALEQAEASTQRWAAGKPFSVLDGIPFGLKDNIDVAGITCTAGTAAYAKRVPSTDAGIYQELSRAGMVLLGKLNMHEAALGATTDNPIFGKCISPLAKGHTPGGSSGGASAALSAQLCSLAFGSDTMGSVRIPAAYCGVIGMIPTRNRLPMSGVVPLSQTLDVLGPLAHTGADLALLMAHLLRLDSTPHATNEVWNGLRVGIVNQLFEVDMDASVRRAFELVITKLEERGAKIQKINCPGWSPARQRMDAFVLSEIEGASYWVDATGPDFHGLSPSLQKMLSYGHRLASDKKIHYRESIEKLRESASLFFSKTNVLLMPTTPGTSFPHTEIAPVNQADWTCLANILGTPALSFPCPTNGLPVACQFMTAPGEDERLLTLGCAIDLLWN